MLGAGKDRLRRLHLGREQRPIGRLGQALVVDVVGMQKQRERRAEQLGMHVRDVTGAAPVGMDDVGGAVAHPSRQPCQAIEPADVAAPGIDGVPRPRRGQHGPRAAQGFQDRGADLGQVCAPIGDALHQLLHGRRERVDISRTPRQRYEVDLAQARQRQRLAPDERLAERREVRRQEQDPLVARRHRPGPTRRRPASACGAAARHRGKRMW